MAAKVDIWDDFYVKGKGSRVVAFEHDNQSWTVGSSSAAPALTIYTQAFAITAAATMTLTTYLLTLVDKVGGVANITWNNGVMRFKDTARLDNFSVPKRFGYRWIAGDRGKPGINADMASGTEATREPADPWFELLGTNAASACSAHYAEGGITLTTAGADNDQVILAPHLDTAQSGWANTTWGTDQETEWECLIKTGAAITNMILWCGLKLTNTPTIATDNDQVFVRYQNGVNSGKWQVNYSIGGTDTSVDSGVTVEVSTVYHIKIVINSSRIAKVYINGVLVATSTALTDATDFIPYLGIQASGQAAAKAFHVRGQGISRLAA